MSIPVYTCTMGTLGMPISAVEENAESFPLGSKISIKSPCLNKPLVTLMPAWKVIFRFTVTQKCTLLISLNANSNLSLDSSMSNPRRAATSCPTWSVSFPSAPTAPRSERINTCCSSDTDSKTDCITSSMYASCAARSWRSSWEFGSERAEGVASSGATPSEAMHSTAADELKSRLSDPTVSPTLSTRFVRWSTTPEMHWSLPAASWETAWMCSGFTFCTASNPT